MENYKIVTKFPSVTTVEITVVEITVVEKLAEKSTSGSIDMVEPTEKWIRTTVVRGYFNVGQTVEVYNKKRRKSGRSHDYRNQSRKHNKCKWLCNSFRR